MARKQTRPKPLRRKVAVRAPRKTLLVFCEGLRTEPEYLEALRRQPEVRDAASVDLRIHRARSGAVPLTLVETALAEKRRAEQEEGEVDEVSCLFDTEWPINHPRLHQARDLAARHGVKLAISNPCFELWLVLHFTNWTSWLDNDSARRERRKHDGSADKGLDGQLYMPRRAEAARRAARLDERHAGNGTSFPKNNPSCGMYRLLESIASAAAGG